jgi:hypothetical protein
LLSRNDLSAKLRYAGYARYADLPILTRRQFARHLVRGGPFAVSRKSPAGY